MSRLHRAAARGDLAWLRRWRWGLRVLGIDSRDQEKRWHHPPEGLWGLLLKGVAWKARLSLSAGRGNWRAFHCWQLLGGLRTPLHLACANGHADVVRFLVRQDCQVDLCDNWRRSPLMKAVQSQQEECVAVLLEHGANPDLQDADGNTALHLAVLSHNVDMVLLLLEHDADIDAENKEGCTPLILAVSEHHKEMAEVLLKIGADVQARDLSERTPLMIAASGGQLDLVRVLEFGADVSQKDAAGRTAGDDAVLQGYSSLGKQLAEDAEQKSTGEASVRGGQGCTAPGTLHWAEPAGFMLGAPAVDRGATDDWSEGGSIRSSEEEGNDDSWSSSEEELDFSPKQQKPNLRLLMDAFQQRRTHSDGSRMESPKSPKKSLQERTGGSLHGGSPEAQKTTSQDSTAEHSGSTCHTSAPAEEKDISEAVENSGVQGMVLAGALEKQSKSEALLEETKCCCRELRKRNLGLQEELEEVKSKVQDLVDWHRQSVCCVGGLRVAWDEEERELRASFQKLQDLLLASSGTDGIIKELEERVQRLQMENARLEAIVQQQSNRIEGLWRDLQASAWVDQLSQPLQTESKKDTGTEAEAGVSQEEFSSECGNQEQLEKSEQQLQEEEKLLAASPVQRPSELGRPGTHEALNRKPSSVRSIQVGRRIYTCAAKTVWSDMGEVLWS
ncbi:ankyrin repeat domain-containing protein 62-like [Apus apus]|uniref:ankyrin repeat domain-containing protein 62-like n=1 Tax=Apus apus TaxID=8895 RepID=UPI0021F8991C|nr:ankyrin repeat domain-containing protein 62-like [Apus apus]